MIISRSFIHAYLSPTVDFANQNGIHLPLLHIISGSCSLTYYQNKVIHKVKDEVHSVHHDKQAYDIPSFAYNFFIWNTTIRKLVTLPRPGITFRSHGRNNASVGFGFDAMTNDYKVVRLVTLLEEDEQPTTTLAEVYSLATGTWSNLGCVSPASLITKTAADEEEALTEPSNFLLRNEGLGGSHLIGVAWPRDLLE
ncbi:hypothetical protein L3X38_022961 [Prunus dulcis]|uniref:F-box associated beta-propeller type 3 domain-containing protein n=1 Tax=Prunus dulcis TaxID=3755 RepID=A0AAD4VYY4_PRUDU|nr:hypothetical protein L3X38_022961 [Prunus dulcis]